MRGPARFEAPIPDEISRKPRKLAVAWGSVKSRLPSRTEVAILAGMALVCAVVVAWVPKHDDALLFASMPLFFVSSMMGMRRSQRRARGLELPFEIDEIR